MLINFGKKFSKKYDRSPAHIKEATKKRLELFKQNPFNPLLNNHALTGQYLGYRSIDITGDWRAIFSEYQSEGGEKIVIFELINTHSELYG